MEHAQTWCTALGSDLPALRALYTDYFTLEHTMVDDHEQEHRHRQRDAGRGLGASPAARTATYTFTRPRCSRAPAPASTHWDVTIEGASTYRGLPTGGKTLDHIGSTFHEFDADGRILLESTCWEDNRVFIQLVCRSCARTTGRPTSTWKLRGQPGRLKLVVSKIGRRA